MAESMKSNLPAVLQNSVEEVTAESGSAAKKISKPEDLVRIYDIILQVIHHCKSIKSIQETIFTFLMYYRDVLLNKLSFC